jgi:murein DD-endopeptidase MepM/ murein hydrolase activator NlpD
MVYPVKNPHVNCGFGVRGSWAAGYHPGIDYDASIGTRIYATKSGTVQFVGTYNGYGQDYGYHIIIKSWHKGRFITHLYAHTSRSYVRPGQKVTTGQVIGLSGNTGRTFGAHLHYEERHAPYGYYNHHNPVLPMWSPLPVISLSKVQPGKRNLHVRKLKRRLNRYFPKQKKLYGLKFGKELQARYALYQRIIGYKGKQADGRPGRASLERLGFRVVK